MLNAVIFFIVIFFFSLRLIDSKEQKIENLHSQENESKDPTIGTPQDPVVTQLQEIINSEEEEIDKEFLDMASVTKDSVMEPQLDQELHVEEQQIEPQVSVSTSKEPTDTTDNQDAKIVDRESIPDKTLDIDEASKKEEVPLNNNEGTEDYLDSNIPNESNTATLIASDSPDISNDVLPKSTADVNTDGNSISDEQSLPKSPSLSPLSSTPSTPASSQTKKKLTMQERLAIAVKDKKKKSKKGKKSKKLGVQNEIEAEIAKETEPANHDAELELIKKLDDSEAPNEQGQTEELVEGDKTVDLKVTKIEDMTKEELLDHYRATTVQYEAKISNLASQLENNRSAEKSVQSTSPIDEQLRIKDEQIAGLIEEGEKLSMKELKYTTMIKNLRSKDSQSQSAIESLESKLSNLDSKHAELKKEFFSLKEVSKEDKTKLKDMKHLEANYKDLSDRYDKISQELTEHKFKNYEKKMNDLQEKLAAKINTEKELNLKLEQEKIQVSLLKSTSKKEVDDLNLKIEDLENSNKSMKEEYDLEIARLETKVEKLRFSNEDSKTDRSNSTGPDGDSQNSGSNGNTKQLKAQLAALQHQYQTTLDSLQTLESTYSAKITTLSQSYNTLKKSESAQAKSLKKMVSQLSELKEEHARAIEASSTHEVELAEMRKEVSLKQDEINTWREKYEELKQKHQESTMQLEKKLLKVEMELQKMRVIAPDDNNSTINIHNNGSSSSLLMDEDGQLDTLRSGQSASTQYLTTHLSRSSELLSPSQFSFWNGNASNGNANWRSPEVRSPSMTFNLPVSRGNESNSFNYGNINGIRRDSLHGAAMAGDGTNSTINGVDRDSISLNFETSSKFDSVSQQASPFLTSPNPAGGLVPGSGGGQGPTGATIQLIGKLSSKLSRIETELSTTKEELKKSYREKNELSSEMVQMMDQIAEVETIQERNRDLEQKVNELEKREKVSLEVLGEKSEIVEELRCDVADLKDLLRQQVEQMIEMQQQK
ncbi:Sgm1 protein [Saccharomycopsis crataegensis]|uniref:Sgm1 protein n=1 Tax=Saccharomycopsis crataegensis TaxID=43959 RepID=A0AAV5QNT9_9ASCO|nr:Sgm1 protein [Saccharomycopsis crataegensis]